MDDKYILTGISKADRMVESIEHAKAVSEGKIKQPSENKKSEKSSEKSAKSGNEKSETAKK